MASSDGRISVLIAGATGSTGRELVSRLVSHPDVSRVVALARHPIPVNRWASVFPHLHSGDALRCLSVVPVDWERIAADVSHLPASPLSGEEGASEARGAASPERLWWVGRTRFSSGRTPRTRPAGYVRIPSWMARDSEDASGPDEGPSESDDEWRTARKDRPGRGPLPRVSRQAFLPLMLRSSFYLSVFANHQVAINCLGTSRHFTASEVQRVDYELSLAFAQVVQMFNCTAHSEPSEEEERLLVESTSRELDDTLWGEVHMACYGKPAGSPTGVAEPPEGFKEGRTYGSEAGPSEAGPDAPRLRRGAEATLRHFCQVSVLGAGEHSPVPYLRAHGCRDRDLLALFRRPSRGDGWDAPGRSGAAAAAPWWPSRPHVSTPASVAVSEGEALTMSWPAEADPPVPRAGERRRWRDTAPMQELADITIWRPGLLQRPKQRLWERLLSLVMRPVSVYHLAGCIVDDIVASAQKKPEEGVTGTVKIISGMGVGRRVYMKAMSEALDEASVREGYPPVGPSAGARLDTPHTPPTSSHAP